MEYFPCSAGGSEYFLSLRKVNRVVFKIGLPDKIVVDSDELYCATNKKMQY